MKNWGFALSCAHDSLTKDKDVVLAAVKNEVDSLAYADDSLKKDPDILAAVEKYKYID